MSPDADGAWLDRRWRALWTRIDRPAPSLRSILDAYAAPGRAYHTLEHLVECLRAFDAYAGPIPDTLAELALWYHDLVYDTTRDDNEARSAARAVEDLRDAGVDEADVLEVARLILETRHVTAATDPRAAVVCDADLAILGADPARFARYEAAIREEYAWVPEAQYRAARADILRRFLARPHIYATAPARDALEARARANLHRSLAALRGDSPVP